MAAHSVSSLQCRWLPIHLQLLRTELEGEDYLRWISYPCSACLSPILVCQHQSSSPLPHIRGKYRGYILVLCLDCLQELPFAPRMVS
jgi:hypothetical protein